MTRDEDEQGWQLCGCDVKVPQCIYSERGAGHGLLFSKGSSRTTKYGDIRRYAKSRSSSMVLLFNYRLVIPKRCFQPFHYAFMNTGSLFLASATQKGVAQLMRCIWSATTLLAPTPIKSEPLGTRL